MYASMKTISVSTRLWLLVCAVLIAVFAEDLLDHKHTSEQLRTHKEQQLEQQVETAHSILQHYEGEARVGRLSDVEARRQAIAAIRPLRYGTREYFFIIDHAEPVPSGVLHPIQPELEGFPLDQPAYLRATSSRAGSRGPYQALDNANIFAAMRDVAHTQGGKGYVTYDWPKPLGSGSVTVGHYPKLAFVMHFEPWGWIVGSGVYMDELEAAIARNGQARLIKGVIWLLLFGALAWAMLRSIMHPLHALQDAIQRLRGDPDHSIDLPARQPRELAQLGNVFRSLMGDLQQSRKALNASLDELRLAGSAFAAMSEGVVVTDAQRRIVSINPAFTRINGYTRAEVLGKNPSLLKSRRHDDAFYRDMWHEIEVTGSWSGEIWNRARDGRVFLEWLSISTLRDDNGQVLNYIGVFSDITERKRSEADLRIAATAFEAQEGMFITDAHGTILRVNLAFTTITGYTPDEAVGKSPRLLKSGRHDADFYARMQDSIDRTGSWQGEIWNRRKNGEIFPEWLTITAVHDHEGNLTHHVSTLTDISQRKAAESEIQHLAFYDPLTNLPNRRLLIDRLRQALSSSARTEHSGALLFIDLDNFKLLNDSLGHDKGDLLLQSVATRLLDCVRTTDTVARLGGDEFVVLLEDLSATTAEATAQAQALGNKILTALNQSYTLAGHVHHNSPSIGIALFSDHHGSVEEVLMQADLAMYQAKAAGRNTLRLFSPEMQSVVSARAALETDLRAALNDCDAQFALHYQPQVDRAGNLTGAEALLRWHHPQRGNVSPADFIPLAEDCGLILRIGRWVLETACRQLAAWARDPDMRRLSLAVNVSAMQYRQADFVAQVMSILVDTGADPHKLKLELTESLLLDNVEDIIAKMTDLKACGVSFSLDDFGTGYSSLSYLKRLPLDQLKIDQSFVRDLLTDPNDIAIARAIVGLASSLGLTVIAEGVETEAQRLCLEANGCLAYQGYLFGRPAPAEALSTWERLPIAAARRDFDI
jgi:diguanylate cyclase (GGDEF)-like protein/PAS domain S-box-containing protein